MEHSKPEINGGHYYNDCLPSSKNHLGLLEHLFVKASLADKFGKHWTKGIAYDQLQSLNLAPLSGQAWNFLGSYLWRLPTVIRESSGHTDAHKACTTLLYSAMGKTPYFGFSYRLLLIHSYWF